MPPKDDRVHSMLDLNKTFYFPISISRLLGTFRQLRRSWKSKHKKRDQQTKGQGGCYIDLEVGNKILLHFLLSEVEERIPRSEEV